MNKFICRDEANNITGFTLTNNGEPLDESSQEWIDFENPPPTSRELKLAGFEFEGVMCSATGVDANGVLQLGRKFEKGMLTPTVFEFENGNKLPLNSSNFAQFETEWYECRDSFYKPE